MCGRVSTPSSEEIVYQLNLKYNAESIPGNINLKPTQLTPVITNTDQSELQFRTWWLIPAYSTDGKPSWKYPMFNAMSERLFDTKSYWNKLIGKKHCVFITHGFYEWNYEVPEKKKGPHPHLIRTKNEPFTLMAGLWENWERDGQRVQSCTIITNPANEFMTPLHNASDRGPRMPAFLTMETAKIWLDDELPVSERIQVIHPVDDDFLQAVEVKKVGDPDEYNNLVFC